MQLTATEYVTTLDALLKPPQAAQVGNAYAAVLGGFILNHPHAAYAFLKELPPTGAHRLFIRAAASRAAAKAAASSEVN
jgi:hypothetical protein